MAKASTAVSRRTALGKAGRLAGCAALALLVNGASPRKANKGRAKPATRPAAERAWLNAKGICVFPLARNEIPRTGAQLVQSMLDGWKNVFWFKGAAAATPPAPATQPAVTTQPAAEPRQIVELSGGRYPAVDEMTIDLTGAVANPKHKVPRIPDPSPTGKAVAVRRFTMVAEPMVSDRAKINLKVTGTDVRLELQHDGDGQPMLMLADAKEGTVHFDLTHGDLERLMLARAKLASASQPVTVRSVELDLQSLGPRSLKADLHVSTLVALVPAGMRFTARVDIDDRMNAKISGLTCDGDELLGPLIVGLIRPGLAKFNGMTKPLLAFPSGNLQLRDVRVQAGDRIILDATFGAM